MDRINEVLAEQEFEKNASCKKQVGEAKAFFRLFGVRRPTKSARVVFKTPS